MPITERTLKGWRKESLWNNQFVDKEADKVFSTDSSTWYELNQRILRTTQELLDLHLIRKK